jgi:hypothetical protein
MKTDRQDIVLLCFITLIGLFIRISPAFSAPFPLNDGGLFYKMILDLQENHFVLPMFTSYNHADIPFAYPPLAFYLYAVISEIFNISLLKLMQFGPAIISALSIPAFFLLAQQLMDTKPQVLFSVLIFSLVPRAFDWLIMGGGITRSLGLLFALLAIRQSILLFSSTTTKNFLLMILWNGLVLLTHPEAAIHTCIAIVLIYFWKDRTISGLKHAAIIAACVLLLSAPWWITVLMRHGGAPFMAVLSSADQDSDNLIARILILFRFDFTDEPFLTLTSVLGLIGLFGSIAAKKYFLPSWLLLIQLIEPRGGSLYLMIPISMLAGFALDRAVLPLLQTTMESTQRYAALRINPHRAFIGFLFLYGLLSASTVASKISQQLTLTKSDLAALAWVRENTPDNGSFVVITQGIPLNDATSEWFPALTERKSIATLFGYEWLVNGGFGKRIQSYEELQKCADLGEDCLEEWIDSNGQEAEYIYLRNKPESALSVLWEDLKSSPKYQILYEESNICIYQVAPGN